MEPLTIFDPKNQEFDDSPDLTNLENGTIFIATIPSAGEQVFIKMKFGLVALTTWGKPDYPLLLWVNRPWNICDVAWDKEREKEKILVISHFKKIGKLSFDYEDYKEN